MCKNVRRKVMEYNKTKRGLELGAVLTALIYCAIDLIVVFVGLINFVDEINAIKEAYGTAYYETYVSELVTEFVIAFIIAVALLIIELVLACKLLKKPEFDGEGFKSRKKLRVTFLVISCVLAFFLLISGRRSYTILALLIFAPVIVLESVAMSKKDIKEQLPNSLYQVKSEVAPTTDLKIEQKLAELKHLKELGVINEEQYEEAVQKNIKQIM